LGALLDVAEEEAQPAVGRALPGEALIRGEVCEGDEAALPVVSQPVGRILTAGEVVQPEGPSEMMSEYY
jgi:hypothetical protein